MDGGGEWKSLHCVCAIPDGMTIEDAERIIAEREKERAT
jgi:hypothetical protein